MPHPAGTIARLMAAEIDFLTDFGWTPIIVTARSGGTYVQFRCPETGAQMDRWMALGRQKAAVDFQEA
jgi:hypothetical protein